MSVEFMKIKVRSRFIIKLVHYFVTPILYILGDISLVGSGFIIVILIYAILSGHIEALTYIPLWIISYSYIACSSVAALVALIHFFYWHYFKTKTSVSCHHCGETVCASFNIEERAYITGEIDALAEFHMYRDFIRKQIYRPRLHYICKSCGHEEYICPYCHQPIGKDESICPHCKKRNEK